MIEMKRTRLFHTDLKISDEWYIDMVGKDEPHIFLHYHASEDMAYYADEDRCSECKVIIPGIYRFIFNLMSL